MEIQNVSSEKENKTLAFAYTPEGLKLVTLVPLATLPVILPPLNVEKRGNQRKNNGVSDLPTNHHEI